MRGATSGLIRSPLSVAGMVLTTISAVVFLVVFLADLFGLHTNPYIGIVFFLVLPALFVFGLVLIPLGAWVERRRRAAGKAPSECTGRASISTIRASATTAVIVFLLTIANIVIVSLAAYRGVEYMDSVAVLRPGLPYADEAGVRRRIEDGPHARVACVAVPRRPRRDLVRQGEARRARAAAGGHASAPTRGRFRRRCRTCARPATPASSATGRRSSTATRSAASSSTRDDEKNTESVTTLRMHVGGGNGRLGSRPGHPLAHERGERGRVHRRPTTSAR